MFYTFPTKNCLTSSLYFLPIGRLMPATMTLEHEKRWISSDLSCARQSKQAFSALAYRKRAWRGGWLFGERCVRFFLQNVCVYNFILYLCRRNGSPYRRLIGNGVRIPDCPAAVIRYLRCKHMPLTIFGKALVTRR